MVNKLLGFQNQAHNIRYTSTLEKPQKKGVFQFPILVLVGLFNKSHDILPRLSHFSFFLN
jgi:hypothetical protein